MVDFLQRTSITMPAPTLVNGRPLQPWQPTTITRLPWGKLQLIIAGRGCTRLRGKRWVPFTDDASEPFGDGAAEFALPGVTEYDDPADFGITPLALVRWRRKDPAGVFHTLYEGEIADFEPDAGQGLVVQCIGTLLRTDLLKEPPELFAEPQDAGRLIARAFNRKRRDHALHIGEMRHVTTGILVPPNADFGPFLTGAIQSYLSQLTTDDGDRWTIKVQRPRTPKLVLKDTTTLAFTVRYGTPGVDVQLSKDFTTATTGVWGSGTNGHCTWLGARFPNLVEGDTPAFPLAVGETFVAGDGQTGFAEFAAYLRHGQYGTIVSDDTYEPRDVDNVEQFQDRAGITVDGIVGAQTWEAAFEPGFNQGSLRGAYVGTIWEKTATRRRKTNAQGADTGHNPGFDPTVPAVEDYVPFGDNVSKHLGRKTAKQIVDRNHPAGRTGTVVFSSDPPGMSRWAIEPGDNFTIDDYEGGQVTVHVAGRQRDWRAGIVSCTVDEKARDLLTLAAIHQRRRDVSDLTRREKFGRVKSKLFDDYGTWLCEDGASYIPIMNQQGGYWNTQRIAAAPKGGIERVVLAMGSGLTQHLLNQAMSDDNIPDSIPGATRGCMLITTKPIKPSQITNMPGLSTPLHVMDDGTNPWDFNENRLNRFGKIYAVGGPSDGIGFYPDDNDPGDGSIDPTGLFEDGGGITYGPTGYYWLWVSIWTEASCKVGGRLYPSAPG